MNDRQRLEAIVSVVCRYLPPDGISREEAMSQIIELVDPLPEQEEKQTHTDHPSRHWDRTFPACVAEAESWDTSDMAHRSGGLSVEQAEKQEPVAYKYTDKTNPLVFYFTERKDVTQNPDVIETELYTAPLRKEWVGLTELEIAHSLEKANLPAQFSYRAAARAGINAFKEKNT